VAVLGWHGRARCAADLITDLITNPNNEEFPADHDGVCPVQEIVRGLAKNSGLLLNPWVDRRNQGQWRA
jgi:hypothetical protein